MGADKKTKARKDQLWEECQDACSTYSKMMFVNTDNVTSKQICIMRRSMRAVGAKLICGKNTMMKKAIAQLNTAPTARDAPYTEESNGDWAHMPHLDKVMTQLKGNTSIIFSNNDLSDILEILNSQVREAPARVGSIAPKKVTVPAGATGLDPRQTGFFGNLGIATKIVKAQIEILNDFDIIAEGDKVSPGQAALLDKLKIRPFEYKMTVRKILQDGQLFDPAVLSITTESILAKFSAGIANCTAVSLGSGYVVQSAVPHLIMRAFKNLAAVSFSSDYSFP
jgi:large subunit ribosomal protein LP0